MPRKCNRLWNWWPNNAFSPWKFRKLKVRLSIMVKSLNAAIALRFQFSPHSDVSTQIRKSRNVFFHWETLQDGPLCEQPLKFRCFWAHYCVLLGLKKEPLCSSVVEQISGKSAKSRPQGNLNSLLWQLRRMLFGVDLHIFIFNSLSLQCILGILKWKYILHYY